MRCAVLNGATLLPIAHERECGVRANRVPFWVYFGYFIHYGPYKTVARARAHCGMGVRKIR